MSLDLVWRARSLMSVDARARVRRIADKALVLVGSIKGARRPATAIGLTFDDGPDGEVTGPLLDLLRRRGARATFFVLTDRVARHSDLVRRIVDEGHEIALHADRHDRLTEVPLGKLRSRLRQAKAVLEAAAGCGVKLFRPPFGAQSLATYLVARSAGLDVVVWGPYGEDWIESTPADVAARSLKSITAGDILLLHDGIELPRGEVPPRFDRVAAVELVLDGLAERGLTATTVGELISGGNSIRTAWFRP